MNSNKQMKQPAQLKVNLQWL